MEKDVYEQEIANVLYLKTYGNTRKKYWEFKRYEKLNIKITKDYFYKSCRMFFNVPIEQQQTSVVHINKLRQKIKDGEELPAIAIEIDDNGDDFIVDGNHRVMALFLEGVVIMPAIQIFME